MSEPKLVRWGIASAGLICHDFTNAIIGVLPQEEHQVPTTTKDTRGANFLPQMTELKCWHKLISLLGLVVFASISALSYVLRTLLVND